jgi:hypothetical protein
MELDLDQDHTFEVRYYSTLLSQIDWSSPAEDLGAALEAVDFDTLPDDSVLINWRATVETPEPPAPPAPAPITMGVNPITAPVVNGVTGFTAGESVTVTGFGLGAVTKLLIGGIEVPVTGNSSTGFSFIIPAGLAPGTYDKTIIAANGTLTYAKALVIAAKSSVTGTTPGVSAAPVSATFSPFAIGSAQLTTKMKSQIRTFINKHAQASMMVEITGYTMGPRVLKSDTKLALDRAMAVRNYIKSLRPTTQFKAMKSATLTTAGAQFRSAKVEISFNS